MSTTGITQKGSDGSEVPPDTIWRWSPDDLSLPINPTWVLKGAGVEAIGCANQAYAELVAALQRAIPSAFGADEVLAKDRFQSCLRFSGI
jgi:hypothetical protein